MTADIKRPPTFKFEQLGAWKLALEYINLIYGIAEKLPSLEEYSLKSQIVRAGTAIALNIAGSAPEGKGREVKNNLLSDNRQGIP